MSQATGAGGGIFICHSYVDEPVADGLVTLLRDVLGLDERQVFCSSTRHYGARPGQPWRAQVLEAATRAELALLLVTPAFLRSPECNMELGVFWSRQTPLAGALIGVTPDQLGGFLDREQVDPLETALDPILDTVRQCLSVERERGRGLAVSRLLDVAHQHMAAVAQSDTEATSGPVGEHGGKAGSGLSSRSTLATTRNGQRVDIVNLVPGGVVHLDRFRRRGHPRYQSSGRVQAVAAGTHDPAGEHREIFEVLECGLIRHRNDWSDGGKWLTMTERAPGPLAALATVSARQHFFRLYALEDDGGLWRTTWPGEGDWRPWEQPDISVPPIVDFAVTSRLSDHEDLFLLDVDGVLWNVWTDELDLDAPLASPPERFGQSFRGARSIAACSGAERHCEVFIVDADGVLHHAWRHPSADAMTRFEPMHPQPDDPFTAVAAAGDRRSHHHVVARDVNGRLWERKHFDGAWSNWSEVEVPPGHRAS